jgi:phage antirepressor YoqD-like protein
VFNRLPITTYELPVVIISFKKRNSMQQDTFSISQTAKLIDFPGGQNQFANWLRENKMVKKNLEPMSRFYKREYFTYKEKEIRPGMFICITRITPKGLKYTHQKYKAQTKPSQKP